MNCNLRHAEGLLIDCLPWFWVEDIYLTERSVDSQRRFRMSPRNIGCHFLRIRSAFELIEYPTSVIREPNTNFVEKMLYSGHLIHIELVNELSKD